ncbi:4447_t:CDS:2, partial [Scutellospora calospora]
IIMVQKSNDGTGDNSPTSNGLANDQQEDIWTSILKGVSSSKIVPTKNLLILGDRESGKSTLIRHLKGEKDEEVYEVNGSVSKGTDTSADENSNFNQKRLNDLALSYTFTEVKEDDAEDTLARLGIYQLAGSQEAYQSLLHFALNSTTLPDSLVVIVLDWARPWTFVETLQRWIKFIELGIERVKKEGAVGSKDNWTKGKAIIDEMQEAHASTANGAVPASSEAEEVELPLGDGVLTTNLAVPLVVVCTKSDNVSTLEKQMDYKEEQFDYIQQSLRTICLKYGAALFYTTTRDPKTFENLRQYIHHRLLGSKFNVEPNYVERDTVLVPTGWDSWNQIKYLRDGFDCDGLLQGWDLDMTGEKETTEDAEEVISVKKVYEDVPLTGPSIIEAEDEQEFFKRHFDTLQKANNERPPSVVGPMGAPQYAYANIGAEIPEIESQVSGNNRNNIKKPIPTPASPPPGTANGSQPATASPGSSQNEVLANFFQALLTKKANTNTTTNQGSSQTPLSPNEPANVYPSSKPTSTNGVPTPSRRLVESELDRLKNFSNPATANTVQLENK